MASEIKVDTISEKTSANGVTIDSVSLKDGKVATANSIDSDAYVDGSIDTAHIADDQITLAKMAAGTDGNVISYDASGNPVAIATGNDGQVLTSTGAGSPPAFEAAPGGGLVHLSTVNITSGTANVSFTSDIDSTYNAYVFILSDVHPATDAQPLEMTLSTDGGSSYLSSNYEFAHQGRTSGGTELSHAGTDDSVFDMSSNNVGNATNEQIACQIYLHKPAGTAGWKLINVLSTVVDNSAATCVGIQGGVQRIQTAINAVQFKFGSGNIDRGNFSMFGVSNS